MGTGEELDRAAVRKRLKNDVALVVLGAMEQGWRVRAFGHGVKLYCPCVQPDHGTFSVSGTPKSPSAEASRIRRTLSKCPRFRP